MMFFTLSRRREIALRANFRWALSTSGAPSCSYQREVLPLTPKGETVLIGYFAANKTIATLSKYALRSGPPFREPEGKTLPITFTFSFKVDWVKS